MTIPRTAMVLAAGRGERMRPLTERMPKPLVPVAGKALIDHVLDKLADAGVTQAVVNVHYQAGQIEAHLQGRTRPRIVISDERDEILDTGGGVLKALPQLSTGRAFFHMNSDTLWIEGVTPNLARLNQRDGKPQYLRHIPRIWRYLRRALVHPAMGELKAWYDAHVPPPQ